MELASFGEADAATMIPEHIAHVRQTAITRQANSALGLVVLGWRGQGARAWVGLSQPCDHYQCRRTVDWDNALMQAGCRWEIM